jgi:hypothetical protein
LGRAFVITYIVNIKIFIPLYKSKVRRIVK